MLAAMDPDTRAAALAVTVQAYPNLFELVKAMYLKVGWQSCVADVWQQMLLQGCARAAAAIQISLCFTSHAWIPQRQAPAANLSTVASFQQLGCIRAQTWPEAHILAVHPSIGEQAR